jgi:hypothetical protein
MKNKMKIEKKKKIKQKILLGSKEREAYHKMIQNNRKGIYEENVNPGPGRYERRRVKSMILKEK